MSVMMKLNFQQPLSHNYSYMRIWCPSNFSSLSNLTKHWSSLSTLSMFNKVFKLLILMHSCWIKTSVFNGMVHQKKSKLTLLYTYSRVVPNLYDLYWIFFYLFIFFSGTQMEMVQAALLNIIKSGWGPKISYPLCTIFQTSEVIQ